MNLLDYRYDKYSSCGNDGIIEKVFEILSIEKGLFVEFGAWDGIIGCNSKQLIDKGWIGTFIEPNAQKYQELVKNYGYNGSIKCINSFVDTKDFLFDDLVTHEVDFCSIDIDGLDLEIFDSINVRLPKVVCMEGGQMLFPYHERISNRIASQNIQQSLSVIDAVARKKGYRIICTYQDTFMVQDKYYDMFDVEEDLYVLYLQGISSLARRLPWIKAQLDRVGLSNPLIEGVMIHCNYDSYGWSRRKEWAIKEDEKIQEYIKELIYEHENKTLC